jgi:hypothetical protein
MKIRPVGAEFRADGQTDMTKLTVAFRNFAYASSKPMLSICKLASSCALLGFRHGGNELFALLGCYAAFIDGWRFGTTYRSRHEGSNSPRLLTIWPKRRHIIQSTLRNIAEEKRKSLVSSYADHPVQTAAGMRLSQKPRSTCAIILCEVWGDDAV